MILFFKVFFTEFIAEMGDKTQLMLIALTSKYKLRDIILGTGVAILVLNGLAVLAGGLVSEFVPEWVIKMIAALAFFYFAASTIAGDDEEEEEGGKTKIKFAPLAVFCTFFVAEVGDKTQLTAITFGAIASAFPGIVCPSAYRSSAAPFPGMIRSAGIFCAFAIARHSCSAL